MSTSHIRTQNPLFRGNNVAQEDFFFSYLRPPLFFPFSIIRKTKIFVILRTFFSVLLIQFHLKNEEHSGSISKHRSFGCVLFGMREMAYERHVQHLLFLPFREDRKLYVLRAPFDTSQWLTGLPCLIKVDLSFPRTSQFKKLSV